MPSSFFQVPATLEKSPASIALRSKAVVEAAGLVSLEDAVLADEDELEALEDEEEPEADLAELDVTSDFF